MEGLRRCLAGRTFPLIDDKADCHVCHACCLIGKILVRTRRRVTHPFYLSPYPAIRFFLHLARLPGGVTRPSALYFLLPAIGRRWPKPQNMKADILRMSAFPCPSISKGTFQKDHVSVFGEGWGARFFPLGATEGGPQGRASTATQRASPRPGLSLLPTVPPAPRRGRGHPDGWPRNWRARNRRRTGRCAAA